MQKCSESIDVILQLLAFAFFNKIEAPQTKLSLFATKISFEFLIKKMQILIPLTLEHPKSLCLILI